MRCPASFSYNNLFLWLDLVPDTLDIRQLLVISDDLCFADIRDPEPASDLPEPPGAFFSPPDLSCRGYLHFYSLYLWLIVKPAVEHDEKGGHYDYFNYLKYGIHETTPLGI